jgi:hypothetical protein
MKRRIVSLLTVIVLGVVLSAWQSRDSNYNVKIAAAAGFTGPIDINGTAYALWSTRCGATAYTGNVVDVWDSATGSTTQTTITCSSGGTLNTGSPTALATTCASGCRVKTIYDQSGSNKCGGGACDLTQATNANRPTLNTSLLNSKIGMVFTGSSSICLGRGADAAAQAQPITVSEVFNATDTSKGDIFSDSTSNFQIYVHEGGANQANIYAGGTPIAATANDSTTHAAQVFASGASSAMYVDGSNTTGSPGTNGIASTITIAIGSVPAAGNCLAGGAQFFTGNIFEVGIWAADKTANNATMNSNQHTYWNF